MNLEKCGIFCTKYSIFIVSSLIIFFVTGLAMFFYFNKKNVQSKLVVINVLEPSYYEDCNIKGSINIPFDHLEDTLKTLDKNVQYVLYCSNYACTASHFAVQAMKDAGFKNVEVLPGGIAAWYQKGLPYDGPAVMEYLNEDNQPLIEDENIVDGLSVEQLFEKLQEFKIL